MLTHRVKTYAQKFIIMIEIVKIEAQSSFESGQQHHQSGAALANRFGQDRLLGNPTYSDKSSADSTHSYDVYATASRPNASDAAALLQANAYSLIIKQKFINQQFKTRHYEK